MSNQLQTYVEELQAENDNLKETQGQNNQGVPVDEVERLQEGYNAEINKYGE